MTANIDATILGKHVAKNVKEYMVAVFKGDSRSLDYSSYVFVITVPRFWGFTYSQEGPVTVLL